MKSVHSDLNYSRWCWEYIYLFMCMCASHSRVASLHTIYPPNHYNFVVREGTDGTPSHSIQPYILAPISSNHSPLY
jgi:hypothetical protein